MDEKDLNELKEELSILCEKIKDVGSEADNLNKQAEAAFQRLYKLILKREALERKIATAEVKVKAIRYGASGIKQAKKASPTFDLTAYAKSLSPKEREEFIASLLKQQP